MEKEFIDLSQQKLCKTGTNDCKTVRVQSVAFAKKISANFKRMIVGVSESKTGTTTAQGDENTKRWERVVFATKNIS